MQAGAFDFLQKPFHDQGLVDCVQRALAKDRADRAMLNERSVTRERLQSLTPRESKVLDMLSRGKTSKMMAADLGLSPRTVELYCAHVMEKMGFASIAQLARLLMDLGAKTTQ